MKWYLTEYVAEQPLIIWKIEGKTNGLKDFRERYLSGENDFDLIIIMLGTNDVLNNIDFSNQKTADVLKI